MARVGREEVAAEQAALGGGGGVELEPEARLAAEVVGADPLQARGLTPLVVDPLLDAHDRAARAAVLLFRVRARVRVRVRVRIRARVRVRVRVRERSCHARGPSVERTCSITA